jgi:hypothetical protein
MNKPAEPIFSTRPTVIFELPLGKNTRILRPEQAILKIGDKYHDLGAFCYAIRSDKHRKRRQPREVVIGSFLKRRPKQVQQLIKALSRLVTDGGRSLSTIDSYVGVGIKTFLDWADANGFHDCLSGGGATRNAYAGWAKENLERYDRQEFGEKTLHHRNYYIRDLLEATTGLEDLHRGIRLIKIPGKPNGTDPLAPYDFAHGVAINHALFDGLCDLVLKQRPFPYKLLLPTTLNWEENHLWLFPLKIWRRTPHQQKAEREKSNTPYWAYDYAIGRLSTPEEISHHYSIWKYPSERHKIAKKLIANAQSRINKANNDSRDPMRIMLGMIAHNAFLFLFFCNTGSNESVVREIETSGEIDAATLNQQFRSIKFRAGGKQIMITVPVTFMTSLRRFMELRQYLLGDSSFPYLFFTLGIKNTKPPGQFGSAALESLFNNVLRTIDPQLPRMGSRKIRASVADWYQRHHDASITAKVLQNSERTVQKHYDAGSTIDHHDEMSLFLYSVSESAKRQRVTQNKVAGTHPLEEGGCCDSFGHPETLADNAPVKPDCKTGQGCLFCAHRVLTASEEDARKVASAAFVMEQVILGPKHEEALRPLILKCDNDLKKIADFGNCSVIVERVRKDVFQNGNLTPFFADKFQLFLDLGIIV